MRFIDFYQQGSFVHSFEVFPPKTPQGIDSLFNVLKELCSTNPAFVSVTYGAMGSSRDLTSDLAIRIHRELNIPTAFHFTCVGSDRNEIGQYVSHLKEEGINLVVALRGDVPKDQINFTPPLDGFHYANELVAYIRSINGFSMAVAGYPEKHIEAPNQRTDLENLKRKVDAGADIVITQMFFDNEDYFDFVDRARIIGIEVPIIPGIMPILSVQQIDRISDPVGASIPEDLHAALMEHQNDPGAMREIGIAHALGQCRELKERGAPGVHFYILNKAYSVKSLLSAL